MPTPARILRARADARDPWPRTPTERERKREARILVLACGLFATEGRHNITFTNMAIALRMAPVTLRSHFADLDALLAAIIQRHLKAIFAALITVPHDAPDRERQLRAAYIGFTRGGFGGLTEAHLLLVRDSQQLPEDLRPDIEQARQTIGEMLAGPLGPEALLLLDSPSLDAARIEAMLAALAQVTNTSANGTAPATAIAPPEPAPASVPAGEIRLKSPPLETAAPVPPNTSWTPRLPPRPHAGHPARAGPG